MSTVAYRAALVRKIEQAIRQNNQLTDDPEHQARLDGRVEAYSHLLVLIGDMQDD